MRNAIRDFLRALPISRDRLDDAIFPLFRIYEDGGLNNAQKIKCLESDLGDLIISYQQERKRINPKSAFCEHRSKTVNIEMAIMSLIGFADDIGIRVSKPFFYRIDGVTLGVFDLVELIKLRYNGPSINAASINLPEDLDTDRARKYFDRAIELGLMSNDYKWLKGLQLLSCFAREMSLNLYLGKGINADGSPRISWKPFEQLFAIDAGKLRANYNDIQKTGQQPSESHLIDDIFS